MKLAGVQLDFYDFADDLKAAQDDGFFKTAHLLTPEERSVLRDEAYALVMVNEGKIFRKFACVDEGNTRLSVAYFMENAYKLPTEAQKVAAANLLNACIDFGVEVPSLLKTAAKSGMVRKRDGFRQPTVSDEADWNQRTNIQSVSGNQGSGMVMQESAKLKTANVIDVSGLEPDFEFKKKIASRTALNGRYSLDTYSDVEKAISYFEENYVEMVPSDRHEFCVKTAARAAELDIDLPELMARYGSTELSDDVEAHIANRRALATTDFKPSYDLLQEKVAEVSPEILADLLGKVDEEAGLNWYYGGEVMDPYFAVFGGNSAQEKLASWSWSNAHGDSIDAYNLQALAASDALSKTFGDDLAQAMSQNPTQIFDSLPDHEKTLIARMAKNNEEV